MTSYFYFVWRENRLSLEWMKKNVHDIIHVRVHMMMPQLSWLAGPPGAPVPGVQSVPRRGAGQAAGEDADAAEPEPRAGPRRHEGWDHVPQEGTKQNASAAEATEHHDDDNDDEVHMYAMNLPALKRDIYHFITYAHLWLLCRRVFLSSQWAFQVPFNVLCLILANYIAQYSTCLFACFQLGAILFPPSRGRTFVISITLIIGSLLQSCSRFPRASCSGLVAGRGSGPESYHGP